MPQQSGDTPSRLGLILLGASEFPAYREEGRDLDFESFKRSAEAFRRAVETPGHSVFGAVEVLDLFDSPEKPDGIVEAIQTFLHARPDLQDLIIYYCGHGGFLTNKTYTLLIRSSHPWREASTTLPFELTRESLDRFIVNRRLVLVLDCCFAGEAVKFLQSESMGDVIEQQVFHTFPPSGTTLLLASSKDRPGLAPGGEDYTMFTGALVQVLEKGIKGGGPQLTLEDLLSEATQQIRVRWRNDAVIPDIQSPRRAHGDLARRPYFVNAAYAAPPQPSASRAERTLVGEAFESLRADSPRARRLAVEQIVEIVSDTSAPALRRRMLNVLRGVAHRDDSKTVQDFASAALLSLGIDDAPPRPAQPTATPERPLSQKPEVSKTTPRSTPQTNRPAPAPPGPAKPSDEERDPQRASPPPEPRPSLRVPPPFLQRIWMQLRTRRGAAVVGVIAVGVIVLNLILSGAGQPQTMVIMGNQTTQLGGISWNGDPTAPKDISVLAYASGTSNVGAIAFFTNPNGLLSAIVYLVYRQPLPAANSDGAAVITGILAGYDPRTRLGQRVPGQVIGSFTSANGQTVKAFATSGSRRALAAIMARSNSIAIEFTAPATGTAATLVLPVDATGKALWQAVADGK